MSVSPITVDETLCRQCGACVQECSRHISLTGQSGSHVDHTDPLCGSCLHCYAVCPTGAVTLPTGYEPFDDDPARLETVTPETLEYFLAFRRSTRRFKQTSVPRELIERVVQAGRYIPSGGNRHAYEFTVLTDDGVKQQLLEIFAAYYERIRKLMSNKLLVSLVTPFLSPYKRAFMSDPDYGTRMKDVLDRFHRGDDPVFYRAPVVIILHTTAMIPTPQEDCLLAGYNMVMTAQTLGLGTCFVSLAQKGISGNEEAKELLGIDPKAAVTAVVLMGYPEITYHRAVPKPQHDINWV
jgi:nitroreductase/NAD-dependent dihydropyrimidine dehydrogenase PreA subunit